MKMKQLITNLKNLSDFFNENGIEDIYTNSKIYEVLIASRLGHRIINGHAHTPDASDQDGNAYEYKHYKKSSSNHTWTFNDYTDKTIDRLHSIKFVYFVVIDDSDAIPELEKLYRVSGKQVAKYLNAKKAKIENHRKMINVSAHQIETNMKYKLIHKSDIESLNPIEGVLYNTKINEVFTTARKIEEQIKVNRILTSNKLWELLVASELEHKINSEQKKHDAFDTDGRTYEYKVSKKHNWTFQDISDNVLTSYQNDEKIILAVVDKKAFVVKSIAECQPKTLIEILKTKLAKKQSESKEIRRLTSSICNGDLEKMIEKGNAKWIYKT